MRRNTTVVRHTLSFAMEKKSSTSLGAIHLFVWAMAFGVVFYLTSHSDTRLPHEKRFPVPAPGAWREEHSLVPSKTRRVTFPWKLRAYQTARSSIGNEAVKLERAAVCKTPKLSIQVDNPYRSENNMGRVKRSYVCLRFEKQCRGQAMEDLWNRRYMKKYDTYTGTFLMTDTTALNRLKRDDKELYDQVMWQHEGESYLSALDGGDAISGNKARQLSTKRKYSEKFGCDYNSLHMQPPQFTMHRTSECKAFFKWIQDNPGEMWIRKPILGQGGVGITLHSDVKDFDNLRDCSSKRDDNKYIIQHYIKHPLLIHGKKFDIRVYMLIASSNPYFVFYHHGYLRRSIVGYNADSTDKGVFLTNTHFQSLEKGFELEDHIWGFERFQKYLADNNIAGSQYVSTVLDSAIKKTLLYNFMSAKDELVRRKGSYHLFGLDFMIDSELRVHFIEANGYPGFTWSPDFDTRTMVTELFDLLHELHEKPTAFEGMTAGDMYGDFELIYSELEDGCSEKTYDPCVDFATFNQAPMGAKAARTGKIHDSGRRTKYRARKTKVMGAKAAQAICEEKKISPSSKECSKLMKKERLRLYEPVFEEQDAWETINQFVKGM